MIKNITATGRYITVSNINSSTYINGTYGAQGVGNMRFNISTQQMEVFDGSSWIILNMEYANIGLNGDAESLLDWARKKRDEELEWKNLATTSEAVKIALDTLEQAKRQLDVTSKLAREYDTTS